MTVQQGMDSARIREIAGGLRAESTRIGDVQGRGTASAGVLRGAWEGDDAGVLLDRWDSEAVTRLTEAAQLLSAAADDLGRQADDQDEASGEAGGGRGTGGGTLPGGGLPRGSDGGGSSGGTFGERDEIPGQDGYSITGRDRESIGVRTNRGPDGNLHHYDPLTGKRWVEDEDGRWVNESDRFGYSGLETSRTTDRGGGWETERTSTRGEGGGRREWGEGFSHERDFDNPIGERLRDVTENVSTEPFVKDELWQSEGEAAVAQGQWGDGRNGGSAAALSAAYETAGEAGISLDRGAYVEANAEAGAYLGQVEVHGETDFGTRGAAEAYIGAEASAEASAQVGPGGAEISAGGEVFAGGRIEGGVSQDIGDVGSVGVGGSLSYGIGAEADVSAEASWDRIGFSGDVGLTLGVGAEINVDLSISPSGIVDAIAPDDVDWSFWD